MVGMTREPPRNKINDLGRCEGRRRLAAYLASLAQHGKFEDMRSSDIICPNCKAGYRRLEIASGRPIKGEYRCLLCDRVLETLDGSTEVAIRLTVQPEKIAK
jgi:DNA-directed RNA polymerase subunit RPC12/RpoP